VTDPNLENAIDETADWLSANERAGGGWGYNAGVPIDADTTAHAVIFFHAATGVPRRHLADILLRFRCHDGGFGTYAVGTATGGWVASQPDVTPVVALAMSRLLGGDAPIVQAALAYCRKWLQATHSPPSYWWKSAFYAPAMMALLFANVEKATPKDLSVGSIAPETCLDQALALLTLTHIDADHTAILTTLVQRQECDGAWPASTQLSVTDPECLQPWAAPNGYAHRFTDLDRIFTTAVTVYALALALSLDGRI
jgi:hypothetical protein